MKDLILKIEKAIKEAQQKPVQINSIYSNSAQPLKNQFLFFIKPEITLGVDSIKLNDILEIIFEKLEEYSFSIINIQLLGAAYLKEYNVIAQHYGVINQLSQNAIENLNEKSKQKFEEIFNKPINQSKLLGSLEFLNLRTDFTPESLNQRWTESKGYKLGGGTYVCEMQVEDDVYYVINGFHPLQLEHFIKQGRSIVAFTLSSDTDWAIARNNFIGATNPESAQEGSLRRLFLEDMKELGLPEINGSKNGVHLSAGPVEGLVELIRFNSDLSKSKILNPSDFSFGKKITESFSSEQIEKILSNSMVDYKGQSISVFDLTEEKNSEDAIEILREAKF